MKIFFVIMPLCDEFCDKNVYLSSGGQHRSDQNRDVEGYGTH